ncbi:MAG: alpha-galactosidase [Clostridia bacterium]|nr:alpha-galactosidase [Clostridia bacterium]
MINEIFSTVLNDMRITYTLDSETGLAGLFIEPDKAEKYGKRRVKVNSLAEAKIIGDNYSGSYLGGTSMKYSDTTYSLKYDHLENEELDGDTVITTYLKSDAGIEARHTLSHRQGREYFTVSTGLTNNSEEKIRLEMLSSFSIYNISPYSDGAGENTMTLHRLRSKWSQEGRLVSETFEDLQLEECWCYANSNSVRFGQVGSMPVKGYFPFAAVSDDKNGVIWGVQMGCSSSWQMEVTRADDGVCISGGLADREFGHWVKTVDCGENFTAPTAVISVCKGNIDDISARLVSAQEDNLDIPQSEETLPVIFNEYCTTWGNPSYDNIKNILSAIKCKGIDYFVVDCGWFKEDGVRWDISMGDYIPSKTLFPNGIKETADLIKSYGMRAGIWFEFENVGRASKAYHNTDHLLKRDGIPLTTQNRRFWDMNDEWVINYLDERVIGFLKQNGFSYIKVDYNETIGIGCDNNDSLGEGLRQNMQGTADYFRKIKRELPDMVIENCASGGNRLEPCFMSLSSMASFSDAHECVEIPIIAANLHRAILPRQSQIWCVIRRGDSLKRIAYSVSATFLGRMCLSGDVAELTDEQWGVIDRGIAFYKKAVPVIKHGKSRRFGTRIKSERHPEGWQAVVRENGDKILCVIHTFENASGIVSIPVGNCTVKDIYSHGDMGARIENGMLILDVCEDFCGCGILLDRI